MALHISRTCTTYHYRRGALHCYLCTPITARTIRTHAGTLCARSTLLSHRRTPHARIAPGTVRLMRFCCHLPGLLLLPLPPAQLGTRTAPHLFRTRFAGCRHPLLAPELPLRLQLALHKKHKGLLRLPSTLRQLLVKRVLHRCRLPRRLRPPHAVFRLPGVHFLLGRVGPAAAEHVGLAAAVHESVLEECISTSL